jgi:hypothetical protein
MMRRFSVVLAVAGFLALPVSASAGPPDREVLPSGPISTTACGFDVLIEPVSEQFTLMTFPEGLPVVQFITGHSHIRVSSANASLMLNISGPTLTTMNHDGSLQLDGAGPWIFFDHPFTNLPALAYLTGRITFGSDEPTVTVTGRIVDLCALLA